MLVLQEGMSLFSYFGGTEKTRKLGEEGDSRSSHDEETKEIQTLRVELKAAEDALDNLRKYYADKNSTFRDSSELWTRSSRDCEDIDTLRREVKEAEDALDNLHDLYADTIYPDCKQYETPVLGVPESGEKIGKGLEGAVFAISDGRVDKVVQHKTQQAKQVCIASHKELAPKFHSAFRDSSGHTHIISERYDTTLTEYITGILPQDSKRLKELDMAMLALAKKITETEMFHMDLHLDNIMLLNRTPLELRIVDWGNMTSATRPVNNVFITKKNKPSCTLAVSNVDALEIFHKNVCEYMTRWFDIPTAIPRFTQFVEGVEALALECDSTSSAAEPPPWQ